MMKVARLCAGASHVRVTVRIPFGQARKALGKMSPPTTGPLVRLPCGDHRPTKIDCGSSKKRPSKPCPWGKRKLAENVASGDPLESNVFHSRSRSPGEPEVNPMPTARFPLSSEVAASQP